MKLKGNVLDITASTPTMEVGRPKQIFVGVLKKAVQEKANVKTIEQAMSDLDTNKDIDKVASGAIHKRYQDLIDSAKKGNKREVMDVLMVWKDHTSAWLPHSPLAAHEQAELVNDMAEIDVDIAKSKLSPPQSSALDIAVRIQMLTFKVIDLCAIATPKLAGVDMGAMTAARDEEVRP